MYLVADIGGTKVDVGAYALADNGELILKRRSKYGTHEYSGIIEILDRFSGVEKELFQRCCIAIAGPVLSSRAVLTNLNWKIDASEIDDLLPNANTLLVNDMAAHGYGVLCASGEAKICLQKGNPVIGANAAVIAPGTGLGEAIVFWDGSRHIASPCEGGHSSFSPTNPQQVALLEFAWSRIQEHVSCERLISGSMGIRIIADFLADGSAESKIGPIQDERRFAECLASKAEEGNLYARSVFELFAELLGSECGNLALKSMPRNGVYLCGGIPRKIINYLKRPDFLNSFRAKGRFADLLSNFPVYVVIDDLNALRGLAYCCNLNSSTFRV